MAQKVWGGLASIPIFYDDLIGTNMERKECTIPLGIVWQDLGRIGFEWTGSIGWEEKQLWLF